MENEERLDFFAEMLDPAAEIFQDKELAQVYQNGGPVKAVKLAIKKHKAASIALLAAVNCEDLDTYEVPNPLSLMAQMLALANTQEVQILFSSQAPKSDAAASGSATENIEGGAK